MKINKISQKILASVLMLAILICGMFFLTACDLFGGDDGAGKGEGSNVGQGGGSVAEDLTPQVVTDATYFKLNASGETILGLSNAGIDAEISRLVIPKEINGKAILEIANEAFKENITLSSLDFERGSQLEMIGVEAFSGCASLTRVKIPANVTSIARFAFAGCGYLETVSFEGGSLLTSIEEGMFVRCEKLSTINIPSSVTSIKDTAFFMCESLADVALPSGLTSIGGGAFVGCVALENITIPAGVTNLKGETFAQCRNLKSINIPSGMKSIAKNTFALCNSLASVVFEDASSEWTLTKDAVVENYVVSGKTASANASALKEEFSNFIWVKNG